MVYWLFNFFKTVFFFVFWVVMGLYGDLCAVSLSGAVLGRSVHGTVITSSHCLRKRNGLDLHIKAILNRL